MPILTDKYVDNLVVKEGQKILTVYDTAEQKNLKIKGFGVAVMPSGTKTYFYRYLNQEGVQRKYKIGRHGILTAEKARKQAREIAEQVSYGRDPRAELKAQRQEAYAKRATLKTIKDLSEDYLNLHLKSNKSPKSVEGEEYRAKLYILPFFGNRPIEEITHRELEEWRLTMKDKPIQANRVLTSLSAMYSKAIKWGWCEKNPAKGVSKYPEEKRERYLDEEELHRLMTVLEAHKSYPVADALRLIVLTGSRRGEVLNATWEQFNLEKGVWIKPSHMTKQKKTEHLPLSGEALEFVKDLYERATVDHGEVSLDSYVFPGKIPGEPLKEIKKFWARVCREAGLKDVHIHDLRHTYASYLVSSGLSLPVIGKLLGHTQAGTTHRYAHLANDTLRAATDVFGDKIKSLRERRLSEEAERHVEEA